MNFKLLASGSDLLKCAILFLLALIIKGAYVWETSIGGDECFSVYTAQLSIQRIIEFLGTGNNPPLWEIILHFWIQPFGISELSIRIPSLIFNSLTVIPIYLIGERFIHKNVGTFASLMFIFSSFALFISHEARVYSLVGLLSTTSMYLFLSVLKDSKKLGSLVLLTINNALLLYSHYLTSWIIVTQGVLFFACKENRDSLGYRYFIHLLGIVLLFLPFIPILYTRFLDSGMHGTWVSKTTGIESLYNMLWNFSNKPVVTVVFIAIIIFSFLKRILQRNSKQVKRRYIITVHMWTWIPLIFSFLLSFQVGFFLDRYMFFVMPGFYLSILASLNYLFLNFRRLQLCSYGIAVLLMVFTFQISSSSMGFSGYHQKTNLLVEEIKKYLQRDGTAIFICPKWFDKEVVYYLDKNLFQTYFDEYENDVAFKIPLREKRIYPISDFSEVTGLKEVKSIVYIDNHCDFHCPDNRIYKYLSSNYVLERQDIINNNTISIFK